MAVILMLLATLGFVLYKLSTRNFDYWKKRGVPYMEPVPIFGNFFEVFAQRDTIGHLFGKCYNQFKSPYFGMFVFNTPHLIIRDTNLIKAILVKDFNYFSDRIILSDEKCDSMMSNMLFVLKNPEWKHIRAKMSPVFTSGKIKNMVPLINRAALDLKSYLNNHNEKQSLEVKELFSKYATDVIASCAFGIDANSFQNEDAEFRVIGKRMIDFNCGNAFRQFCYFLAPAIVKLLKLSFFHSSVSSFMRNTFWKTIEEREKGSYRRNDLIDILSQIKKEGTADINFDFVGDRIVAQAAMFYAAGFETTSSTLSFTLYELCINPEIQTRVRSEIKSTLLQHKGFTYDAIQEMKYLHMAVCETLRKYPVISFLDRMCLEDYKLPSSNLVIEKGTPVFIPMRGLHYDEQYFPNPDKYDPERFSEENKRKLPTCAYIPFGEGPRICIGERFGLMVVKLGLAHVLFEYGIEPSVDTPVPLVYETKTFLLASTTGLPMKLKKLM